MITQHIHFLKQKNHKGRQRGFTILETLVAISILVLALTAPLAIVAQALRSSYYARDQVTAYYLAQEAIEFLRNKRDNAGLQSSDTSDTWTDLFNAEGSPIINSAGSTNLKAYLVRGTSGYYLKQCSSTCPEVSYDSSASTGILYGSDTAGISSIFTREIIISEPVRATLNDGTQKEVDGVNPPNLRELVISVHVSWKMQNGSQSDGITIKEHLTNWQLEKSS
ncbi:MAG: prepilin-type N-terminal cleavage/methylation domain-containing protein [Candidatus Pacebacteria bacterium]|nr:prepilin-type N-terminal cleavage/methylation domain-containing protein [Candidatus Paceibacterota bacterium]